MNFLFSISYLINGVFRKISHILTDLSCKKDVFYGRKTKFTRTAKVENISGKKENIFIGSEVLIEGRLVVFNNGGKIEIGNNTYIGVNSNIWSGESVKIGNNVLIAHNVNIIDTNSHEINHIERIENYNKAKKSELNSFKLKTIFDIGFWFSRRVTK